MITINGLIPRNTLNRASTLASQRRSKNSTRSDARTLDPAAPRRKAHKHLVGPADKAGEPQPDPRRGIRIIPDISRGGARGIRSGLSDPARRKLRGRACAMTTTRGILRHRRAPLELLRLLRERVALFLPSSSLTAAPEILMSKGHCYPFFFSLPRLGLRKGVLCGTPGGLKRTKGRGVGVRLCPRREGWPRCVLRESVRMDIEGFFFPAAV